MLEVLAAAAPEVPHVVKPALPHSVSTAEFGEGEAAQLFRLGGQGGAAAAAVAQ